MKQPTALFQKLETIRQDRGASCGIHDGIHAVGEPVKHCFGVDCGIAAVHQNGVNAISVQNIQFGSQADHMVCVGVFEQLCQNDAVRTGSENQHILPVFDVKAIHGVNAAGNRFCHTSLVEGEVVRNPEHGLVLYF